MRVAADAWAYFQPDVGVDGNTGLPFALGPYSSGITDSDLAVYIQAIINAQTLNFTTPDGAWGSSARINTILTFLENRPLNKTTNYPFQFYDATTGKQYTAIQANELVDVVDTGKLFVALNNLKSFNSSLASRIDNIVLHGRSNYTALVPGIKSDILSSVSIYSYYTDSGFASFWLTLPSPSLILQHIFSAGNITSPYGNVTLPATPITCDPLLCSIFELNNNDSRLKTLSYEVYLAHEGILQLYWNISSF